MKDDIKIEPCPWCGKEATSWLEGNYVDGWTSSVNCSDYKCGAQGPVKQTPGLSNDEWVIKGEAIRDWNSVAKKENKNDSVQN